MEKMFGIFFNWQVAKVKAKPATAVGVPGVPSCAFFSSLDFLFWSGPYDPLKPKILHSYAGTNIEIHLEVVYSVWVSNNTVDTM